jgi:fatty-acyl-CoA synthase
MHNLSDYIRHWALHAPEQEAIVFGDERISYAAFEQQVEKTASSLTGFGITRGDRVAIQMLSCPHYFTLYMAIARVGAIMVGLNPQYTAEEAAYILEVSRPKLLVSTPAFVAQLNLALEQVPVPKRLLSEGTSPGWSGWEEFNALNQGRDWQIDLQDPVLIVFTSGTTGKPKAAVLSHQNIISNIEVEVRQFGLTSKDRMIHHLPMNHVGGATELAIGAFISGATLLVMERFHPEATLELAVREQATFLGQVPAMFIMEMNLPNFDQFDLSSIRLFVVSGAPAQETFVKRLATIAPVLNGYGMSEAAGFVTYTGLNDDADTVAKTVGKAPPEIQLRVVDERGQDLPTGEIGEVCVRGPCVMDGYYANEQATREAFADDKWYRTGDMGFLDIRAYLTLAGRKKEMYISGGYNVYPVEIEEAISKHPDVMLSACIGVTHEVLGEVGKAFVVAKAGHSIDPEELKSFLAKRLAKYKIPEYVEVRENLPLTPLGKVDKKRLDTGQ